MKFSFLPGQLIKFITCNNLFSLLKHKTLLIHGILFNGNGITLKAFGYKLYHIAYYVLFCFRQMPQLGVHVHVFILT